MEGKRFIRTIRLDGILSYGPGTPEFPLEPLNVLIGPNASGKSNLIEALSLLAAAPRDLQAPIREGGGVGDWLWKGEPGSSAATVEVTFEYLPEQMPIRHRLAFTEMYRSGPFWLVDEVVGRSLESGNVQPYVYYQYRYQGGLPVIDVVTTQENRIERRLQWDSVKADQSILSQRRDPESYPELTYLAYLFDSISLYREFAVGRHTPARLPQKPDLQHDRLLEDASNLGLVLSDIQNRPDVKHRIPERLRDFYSSVDQVVTTVSGGTVQIFFHERDLHYPVPATRLSDGSLRYLCLLAVLCHPSPPPIICIEEPEVGLHPDVITEVAKLLVEASSRSQIFVTTHSDILVDALTDVPEAVVVCEKVDGATQLRRLSAEELKPWIENYRLGELWTRGHIGGNRW